MIYWLTYSDGLNKRKDPNKRKDLQGDRKKRKDLDCRKKQGKIDVWKNDHPDPNQPWAANSITVRTVLNKRKEQLNTRKDQLDKRKDQKSRVSHSKSVKYNRNQ